ncbi:NAD(P)/FAD-dependent oxidoreductase [Nocardia sp. BMG51109]|uniref:NAD(P)/FAD-dependent oxidoreductase n=1 Tax=Nocardia sp. BMG51109 TaxID=1056816 RepID=UPI000463C39C|nr:FAD-dependent oxidoreductase [Nocardia sp. BMG51109]
MTVLPDGRVVIAGTGIAGATAAETLRKEGFTGSVVVVGDDPSLPYRRPMVSKELLSGAAAADKALLRPADFWSGRDIDLRAGTSVRAIDVAAARVECGDGTELPYDALILATGGRPRRLDALFADGHCLRHMHDVAPLRTALERGAAGGAASLVIVGGGLVGMEVAASARALGADVTVLEAGERILERVLPEPVSAAYERLHRDRGVAVHTGVRLAGADDAAGRTRVRVTDGREWIADAVVVAVGMTPNDESAERAGLAVADGIVVDEFCATSASGVYAAGDVARFPNRILGGTERVEHWNHAQAHGAAAARSVLGAATPYEEVPWCWTTQFGRTLQISGWPGAGAEVIVHGDPGDGDFLALCLTDDRLVGALGAGRPREVRAARSLIGDGPFVPRELLRRDDVDLVEMAATPERFGARPIAESHRNAVT